MSSAEQDAALLRLIKDRSEAKRRKALLESELRAAGKSLGYVGQALSEITASGAYTSSPQYVLQEIDKAPEICGLNKIGEMLIELRDLQVNLTGMDRSARELGVD